MAINPTIEKKNCCQQKKFIGRIILGNASKHLSPTFCHFQLPF
jgi:hypothetical protein